MRLNPLTMRMVCDASKHPTKGRNLARVLDSKHEVGISWNPYSRASHIVGVETVAIGKEHDQADEEDFQQGGWSS